jgi:hypothetical protein
MRVLLDECVPHGLRKYLSTQDTVTASYAGLAGYKNGALMKAASCVIHRARTSRSDYPETQSARTTRDKRRKLPE